MMLAPTATWAPRNIFARKRPVLRSVVRGHGVLRDRSHLLSSEGISQLPVSSAVVVYAAWWLQWTLLENEALCLQWRTRISGKVQMHAVTLKAAYVSPC
jgi:hypothetical protein